MKNIKENYSFDPKDSITVIDGRFNISKVDDPIELKRLNNYITTIVAGTPFSSLKENLIQAKLKLNLLGFDFDMPKTIREGDTFSFKMPLKRFGGITGIDDQGKMLNNPYGPGPKFDIAFESQMGILSAKIYPCPRGGDVQKDDLGIREETDDPMSFKEKLKKDISRLKAIKNPDEGEKETLKGMEDALKKEEEKDKKETNEGFSFKDIKKYLKK